MIVRCRLCEWSVRTVPSEVDGCYVLVVLENPWIHCPAEQTTIELVELVDTGAARATKTVVKTASRVYSIQRNRLVGRDVDDRSKEKGENQPPC